MARDGLAGLADQIAHGPGGRIDPPNDPTLAAISTRFEDEGHDLVLVGGWVRDSLVGRESKDIDLCTSAPPDVTARLLAGFGTVTTVGAEYGTICVHTPDGTDFEITTFRGDERYEPGSRHPTVALGVPLEEDLRRRDFTINAIAADPTTGELVDPYGGAVDLDAGVLRCPGDPHQAFTEDPLRTIRLVRFQATYDCQPTPETLQAAQTTAHLTETVSQERLTSELLRIIDHPNPHVLDAAIEAAHAAGVHDVLFRGLDTTRYLNVPNRDRLEPDDRLAILTGTCPNPTETLHQLRIPRDRTEQITRINETVDRYPAATPHDARHLIRHHDDTLLDAAERIRTAQGQPADPHTTQARTKADTWRAPLPVRGNDPTLPHLQGPQIGAWLNQVETAYLNNPDLTAHEARALAPPLKPPDDVQEAIRYWTINPNRTAPETQALRDWHHEHPHPAPTLWRGFQTHGPHNPARHDLIEGNIINLDMACMSTDPEVADAFSWDDNLDDTSPTIHPVTLELEDAYGTPIAEHSTFDWQQEWIVSGQIEIVEVTETPEPDMTSSLHVVGRWLGPTQPEPDPAITRHFERLQPHTTIHGIEPGQPLGGSSDWQDHVVGKDDLSVFRQGGCAIWAAAAHEQTGWPIVVAGPSRCDCGEWDPNDPIGYGTTTDQLCPCQPHHLMVQAPDGTVWDVAGEHDPTAFVEDRDTVDPDGNTIPFTIRPIKPATAIDIIETWHPPTETADLHQWATWSVNQVL